VVADNGTAMGSGSYQQGDPGFGDIRIGGYNFNSTGLAQASLPPPVNNYSIAGDIQFNTGQGFNVGTTYDLQTVATHEIGHALGLLHSGIASAEMYSAYNGVKTVLNADDIAGIRSTYGGARRPDVYDGSTGNGSFATADSINSMINASTLTALVTGGDVTTAGDKDYYVLNVPSGTNGTMKVTIQSKGLSLLRPQVYLYNSVGAQIGSATGSAYGDTITTSYSGVTAGSLYYLVAGSPLSTANGTGAYALSLSFGNNATPTAPSPNTQKLNGNPLSSGGGIAIQYDSETLVNTFTAGNQILSFSNQNNVAMAADGSYVVTWQSANQDGTGQGIYAQRFDPYGNNVGGEFLVNTTTAGNEEYPSVAMDDAGDFVITWSADHQDSGGMAVYAQRYNAAGVRQGGEFLVNTTTAGDQEYSSVAMDSKGNFGITWSSNGQDGGGWGIYAQEYMASGARVGGEFRINTTTAGDQQFSSVAMDGSGNSVVTWCSKGQDGGGWGVYAQRYNASGAPVGGEFRVNAVTAGDQEYASVSMNASGAFVITWSSNGEAVPGAWGVYAREYDASGNPLSNEFQVSPSSTFDQMYSAGAIDSSGNVLFNWSSAPGSTGSGSKWMVFGQQYAPNGSPLGSSFLVNTTKAYDQKTPSVAINDEGDVVSVWAGGNVADNSGVLMQQYTISFVGLDAAAGDTFFPHGNGTGHQHRPVHHHKVPVATHATGGHHEKHEPLQWKGAGAHARFHAGHVAQGPIVKTHVGKSG
jgi:hypothetical protein